MKSKNLKTRYSGGFALCCITDKVTWLSTIYLNHLMMLTGKKHRQTKLQRLQKVQIQVSGSSLVYQINSLWEVLKLKHNFQKTKVVTGKTPFFVIGPLCTHHSICLNIGFWYGIFEWKWLFFDLSAFN